jgi:drug/metabolite transporter (DMT)-like permease
MTHVRSPDHGRATLALIVLTTVWGSTFVVIQSALAVLSPMVLIAARFVVAGLILAVLRPAVIGEARRALAPALALSIPMYAGFALQTRGLATTTPARSAFVTSLSVVIVPFLQFIATRHLPRPRVALAVALAVAGIYVLFRPLGSEWHRGDTLTLLATFCFAFYIVELGHLSRRWSAMGLVLAQCLTIATLAAAAAFLVESPRLALTAPALAAILYLGIVCTALTFVLMTWAQARVEPIEAAVIYTLEPVVAAIFSLALGREHGGFGLIAGGTMVVAATLAASTGTADTLPPSPPEGID